MTGAYVGKTREGYVFTENRETLRDYTLDARAAVLVWGEEALDDTGNLRNYSEVVPNQGNGYTYLQGKYFILYNDRNPLLYEHKPVTVYKVISTPRISSNNRTVTIPSVNTYTLVNEVKEIAQRIVKGYKGVNGVAQQIYSISNGDGE